MTNQDILAQRHSNQGLTSPTLTKPEEIVAWLGAVQSQDYPAAKWGIGQRLISSTDKSTETAFNNGRILRTHILRPTWHFVHPEDIGWMLALTGERVKAVMRSYVRQMGLDEDIFQKSKKIIEKSLKNKNFLTRNELSEKLIENKISWKLNGLAHIIMMAELDGLICSGPIKGKLQTYGLLEERVGKTKHLNREESVGELVKRYFLSHGPAQIKDFVWWSGLTSADARMGLEMNKSLFDKEELDGKTYYFKMSNPSPIPDRIYLLPNYDEYGIAYKDRDAFYDKKYKSFSDARGDLIFQHLIIYQGRLIGTWKRTLKKEKVIINSQFFEKPTNELKKLFVNATKYYGRFLGLKVSTA